MAGPIARRPRDGSAAKNGPHRQTELPFDTANHTTFGDRAGLNDRTTAMTSIPWEPGRFEIKTASGSEPVIGLIGGPFGIRQEPRRWRPVWTVTQLASGLRVTPGAGAGFLDLALAKEFAERLLPLADWSGGGALAEDEALATKAIGIWNDLIARDVAAANAQILAAYSQPPSSQRASRRGNR